MALFEVKASDIEFYKDYLEDFLPDKIIDVHTHVWLDSFKTEIDAAEPVRAVTWPSLVARDNSIEDLNETYKLMFPGRHVIPVIFGYPEREYDIDESNKYIVSCSKKFGYPSLALTKPEWSGEAVEKLIIDGGYYGSKVYLNYAPTYIPEKEIRIFDFLPHHQLEVLNKHGWVAMLHIPRDGRLKDPVNLEQMLEIERRYPDIKLIIAHVGRAYCPEDVGNALEILSETERMMFDFSANTNQQVLEKLIKAVGPSRIMFGSDLPILRMRTRRICEDGNYVNLIPVGLYGDVSGDRHMREIGGEEAEKLTFFMYEEINAFRKASIATGLTKKEVEDIFYNNAAQLFGIA